MRANRKATAWVSPLRAVMTILKRIPRVLSPQLLSTLARMGHGDELVLAGALWCVGHRDHAPYDCVTSGGGPGLPAQPGVLILHLLCL